nr:uncharacterized protein LOC119165398 [Rhipicephalus microplus]
MQKQVEQVSDQTYFLVAFLSIAVTAVKPENEGPIVYPELFRSREADGGHLLKISDDILLRLQKSSVFAREVLVRTYTDGVPMHTYEGMINARMRIVPLQTHERSEDGRMAHILIEIPDDVSNYNEDYDFTTSKHTLSLTHALNKNETMHVTERSADIVYPELFVVVDSAFAAVFNSTADIIKYVSVSVNAMNLKYLGITDPKVKHRLVGLEVTTTGLGYGKNYQVSNRNAGFAYVRTVCSVHKVGIGEDSPPTFKGVHVMSHEIGHIMGCLHDGEHSPFVNDPIPGSESCPFADGYLMSYLRKNKNTYKFSACSITQMRETARSQAASCLHEENFVNTTLKKYPYLPGQLLTRTRQCQNAFPTLKNIQFLQKYGVKDCTIRCGIPSEAPDSEHRVLHLSDGTKCARKNRSKYAALELVLAAYAWIVVGLLCRSHDENTNIHSFIIYCGGPPSKYNCLFSVLKLEPTCSEATTGVGRNFPTL